MSRSRNENAYTRMKRLNAEKHFLDREETYFAGAAVPAVLFAGFIDGGISIALAYGARQLYKHRTGK